MKPHLLETTTLINRPLEEVFAFFSKAENLNLLTPPSLHFNILSKLPLRMEQGALIDYRIRLSGIPFKWKTEICLWEPPHRFADRQLKGPYALWHHTHTFKAIDGHTTEMTDRVEYLSPGWLLEPLIHHLFVQPRVEAIFRYRTERLKELFA